MKKTKKTEIKEKYEIGDKLPNGLVVEDVVSTEVKGLYYYRNGITLYNKKGEFASGLSAGDDAWEDDVFGSPEELEAYLDLPE